MSAAQRHAPALRVEVLPQPALQLAVLFLTELAVAALLAALAAHQVDLHGIGLAAVPLAALLAWRGARVRPRLLLWDGQCWQLQALDTAGALSGAAQAIQLRPVIDLDHWLLLRARLQEPAAPWWRRLHHWALPVYLPLSRRRQASVWPALRATLFAAREARAAPR